MVTTVLGKRGYQIHTASDGQEAFAKALEIKPDLIVTDIMMPRMDGWTLVRTLRGRAELALTPVIFLSALGSDEDRIQGFRLGADDYLPKPFRFEELDLRVQNALRKRRAMLDSVARPSSSSNPGVSSSSTPVPGGLGRSLTPAPVGATNTPAPQTTGGITGNLEQLGLSSLLFMLEIERKSGILLLRRDRVVSRIFVKGGRVTAARIDGATDKHKGPEAVYQLLTWPEGRFDFTSMDVDMDDEMNGQTTQFLLMEGARRIDEGGGNK
jgi:CheY-like chemotaxis protein